MAKKDRTLKPEELRLEDLRADEGNPNLHPREQVDQIAASIKEFGFIVPILVDDKNKILAGHGRAQAGHALGLETVPALRVSHLSKAQKKAFILADNQIAKNSTWDEALLRSSVLELRGLGIVPELTGFSPNELEGILGEPWGTAPERPPPSGQNTSYRPQFGVIVIYEDEAAQESAYSALLELGYDCRVAVT